MNYRILGQTGLKVSEIGFGTWGIGGNSYGETDDKTSLLALEKAFEKGVNFYDTADLYGNGNSESLLARAFAKNRDKIIIATKGGNLPHTSFVMPQNFSKKYLESALNESLKRLKTDYIDLYQLHSPLVEDIERNECIYALKEFQKSGKIRTYGVSVRSPKDGIECIKKYNIPVIQFNYNMIDQRARIDGLFEISEKNETGIISRTPLVFGFLSGKLTGNENFKEGVDHRSNWPKEQLQRWAKASRLFENLSKENKITQVQLALSFCLSSSSISTVIPGMLNVGEVTENTKTSELTDYQITKIYEIYNAGDFYDKSAKEVK